MLVYILKGLLYFVARVRLFVYLKFSMIFLAVKIHICNNVVVITLQSHELYLSSMFL